MKHLDVPVPQILSASYLIPLPAPVTGAEVQRRAVRATRRKSAEAWLAAYGGSLQSR